MNAPELQPSEYERWLVSVGIDGPADCDLWNLDLERGDTDPDTTR